MLKQAASEGLSTAKTYSKFGAIVWGIGLILIGLSFVWPWWKGALEAIGKFKEETGITFAIICTMVAGGIVPTIVHYLAEDDEDQMKARQSLGKILYWAASGAIAFYFIEWQTKFWGEDREPLTVLQKVSFDQLVFAVFVNTNLVVFFYLLIDQDYSWERVKAALRRKVFFHRYLVLLIASYAVWLPAKVVIYAVPADLTFPFQTLMICLWGVILNLLSD